VTRRHLLALLVSTSMLAYLPAMAKPSLGRTAWQRDGAPTAVSAKKTKDHPVAAGPKVASKSGGFSWSTHPLASDANFAEPSIDVDHTNAIYVTTNGGAGVQMWRSWDLGQTFDYQEIPSTNGGGDSEIEFLSNDVGLTADLNVNDSVISRSQDRFENYPQQGVGIEQDRQWIAHRC